MSVSQALNFRQPQRALYDFLESPAESLDLDLL